VFWLIFKGRYNPPVVGNSPGLRSTLLSSCLSCEREISVRLPLVHGKNANFCSCEEDHDVRQLTIHMAVELLRNNTVSHFLKEYDHVLLMNTVQTRQKLQNLMGKKTWIVRVKTS
jgi:hypothetical protein